ncbi:hypothetical protein F0U62_45035 [Cystobacter fuscus]|nr:hypothetical protein F0U62_08830 [Cystobacter fuscus]WNG31555.1 hypothetical protein F0U62_16040 [Cystobacter fuscus]WNG31768.1 hypothetical protein F0U62_28005 [Cystobacter fuscus]WNG31965.1 hypothetical protein F0U62_39195 [Cystobacter fuscus]WNG32003.1 hypothetical protein F0U62_41680 [Cystobacter fuscus]
MLIRFSLQEVRRLLRSLARWVVRPAWSFIQGWSRWRRHHQAVAKLCHYRRRAPRIQVQL